MQATSHYCQVSTANQSKVDIYFVEIISGEDNSSFGYLGSGGAGKTVSGCNLKLSPNITILWEEDDIKREAQVDLEAYARKRNEVFGFWFYYHGKDKWQVVARSGRRDNASIVNPE